MDLRDWAIKSWRRLNEQRFSRRTKRYGRSYETGLTQYELELVIEAIIEALIDELAVGGELNVARLGRFYVVERPSRVMHSNLDNQEYHVPVRWVAQFRPSSYFIKKINERTSDP